MKYTITFSLCVLASLSFANAYDQSYCPTIPVSSKGYIEKCGCWLRENNIYWGMAREDLIKYHSNDQSGNYVANSTKRTTEDSRRIAECIVDKCVKKSMFNDGADTIKKADKFFHIFSKRGHPLCYNATALATADDDDDDAVYMTELKDCLSGSETPNAWDTCKKPEPAHTDPYKLMTDKLAWFGKDDDHFGHDHHDHHDHDHHDHDHHDHDHNLDNIIEHIDVLEDYIDEHMHDHLDEHMDELHEHIDDLEDYIDDHRDHHDHHDHMGAIRDHLDGLHDHLDDKDYIDKHLDDIRKYLDGLHDDDHDDDHHHLDDDELHHHLHDHVHDDDLWNSDIHDHLHEHEHIDKMRKHVRDDIKKLHEQIQGSTGNVDGFDASLDEQLERFEGLYKTHEGIGKHDVKIHVGQDHSHDDHGHGHSHDEHGHGHSHDDHGHGHSHSKESTDKYTKYEVVFNNCATGRDLSEKDCRAAAQSGWGDFVQGSKSDPSGCSSKLIHGEWHVSWNGECDICADECTEEHPCLCATQEKIDEQARLALEAYENAKAAKDAAVLAAEPASWISGDSTEWTGEIRLDDSRDPKCISSCGEVNTCAEAKEEIDTGCAKSCNYKERLAIRQDFNCDNICGEECLDGKERDAFHNVEDPCRCVDKESE